MKKPVSRSIAFAALLFILLSASCQPEPVRYVRSPEQLLEILQESDYVLAPEAAREAVRVPSETRQLVDLRTPAEFEKGHLEGAVNIPAQNLLQPDLLDFFNRKDIEFILYGEEQAQATGPWLFLRQLGVDNLKVLPGGYRYFNNDEDAGILTLAETPDFDYAAVFASAVERHRKEAEAAKPKPVVAPPKKIVPKPKKKKVVEEEGC